jgi:hypothetical protein
MNDSDKGDYIKVTSEIKQTCNDLRNMQRKFFRAFLDSLKRGLRGEKYVKIEGHAFVSKLGYKEGQKYAKEKYLIDYLYDKVVERFLKGTRYDVEEIYKKEQGRALPKKYARMIKKINTQLRQIEEVYTHGRLWAVYYRYLESTGKYHMVSLKRTVKNNFWASFMGSMSERKKYHKYSDFALKAFKDTYWVIQNVSADTAKALVFAAHSPDVEEWWVWPYKYERIHGYDFPKQIYYDDSLFDAWIRIDIYTEPKF